MRATLSRDWEIWGPNGGYLASIALRAAGQLARVARPASFTAHFLGVGDFSEVDVDVRVVKAGKRSESIAVSIAQAGRPLLEGLLRTAAEGPGLAHDVARMPDVPHASELRSEEEILAERGEEQEEDHESYAFWRNFEERPVEPERFFEERKARPPVFRHWYRFRPRAVFDDPWLEAARALMMIDTSSWIAACQPHVDTGFTAPNLDVSAWFHRSDPTSEWLLLDSECPVATGGLMGAKTRIFSEKGQLLATGGAQLYCMPPRS